MARWLKPWQVQEVAESLEARGVEELRALLRVLGEHPAGRKADLVAAVERHLRDKGLRRLYERLDERERAVVAEAVHGAGPELDLDLIRAKYGVVPRVGGRGRGLSSRSDAGLLDVFFHRGTIMPRELRDRLLRSGIVEEPREPRVESSEEPPEDLLLERVLWNPELRRRDQLEETVPVTVREMEGTARHDLLAVLRLIAAGEVRVSAKGRAPSPAVQRRVAEVLEGGDFYPPTDGGPAAIRGYAWPLLLQAAGLAKADGGKLAVTASGNRALGARPEETLRQAWSRWQRSTLLDELRRVEAIRGQTGKGRRGLTSLPGRRAAIAEGLRGCPEGRWVEVDEFFRYLRAADCQLEVSRNPWNLYFSEARYGSLGYEGHGTFEILEGRYTMALLFEYAATLGLIDVAYVPPHDVRSDFRDAWGVDDLDFLSRYDGLLAFRLNGLGAFALGLRDTYRPAPVKPRDGLRVLPTLEVVVQAEKPPPGDEFVLDRYGDRTSERVWRLTRAKLLRAMSDGQPASDLGQFLSSRSAEPLPETVARLIREATERAEALAIAGLALLLECRDAETAALIANDSRAGKHCLRSGERHLAVPLGSEKRFRTALERLGYPLPAGRGT